MRALALLVLAPVALLAQEGGWNQMLGLMPGDSVHVHMLDGHRNNGKFVSTTDTNIVVHQRTGDQTFTKDLVKKVSVRKSSKRWRNAAIGAGIGAAIGVGLAAPSTNNKNTGGFLPCFCGPKFAFGLGAAFAIIGGSVGILFPGYATVYRIPRKK